MYRQNYKTFTVRGRIDVYSLDIWYFILQLKKYTNYYKIKI